ncbi:MAG TPA: Crp/Fnr family transcriptional regulator [Gemmatimonadales bacterium]
MIDARTLGSLAPFADVPRSVAASLAPDAIVLQFGTDQTIFRAGSPPRGWYIVVEGAVRVMRGKGTRQHVVHTERAGGTLAEVPLFAGGTHPATAVASEPTRCVLFTLAVLRAAMAANQDVGLVLLKRLALRVRLLVDRLDDRSSLNVRERLQEYLTERSAASARDFFTLGVNQQALAEELGTVREIVARELRRLRDDGWITSAGPGRYRLGARLPSRRP